MLLLDRSFGEVFGSLSREERAQHRHNRSLDQFSRSRYVLAALWVVCNPLGMLAPAGVWSGTHPASTYFLLTPLGKKLKNIQSTCDMWSKDDDGDKTNPFNQANINHPTSIEELPKELKQQVEAKFGAILKAFLESCTKDRREKITQYKEPDFSELILLHHQHPLHLR